VGATRKKKNIYILSAAEKILENFGDKCRERVSERESERERERGKYPQKLLFFSVVVMQKKSLE
jgi:hypothetical protein